ncbi:hypothetical protein ABZ464_45380 [Streptomyces sp. NPDC005820]|uniref:hypothetical protein n=1 Tax=Streptomyces sp. NPDC005820 TaxID=3157069 RepID=UPI003409B697
MTHPPEPAPATAPRSVLLRRWPTWAGIGATALLALDLEEGVDLAPALAASALIYLGAAALRRPSAVWPLFLAATVAIAATGVLGGGDLDPTWVLLALAVPLLFCALRPGALDAPGGLPLQIAAMLAFGGAAALAVGVGGDTAAYLVAGGLLGHALWDARHHRIDRVVTRPYAEFCLVLDVLVAVLIVAVTLTA